MIDTFLLLTPFLLLAVVALLGFVGCDIVFGIKAGVGPPTFSPPAGAYNTSPMITLTAQASHAIYYTTDGTAASTQSTKYTGPFPLTKTTLVNALAQGDDIQAASSAKYYVGPINYQQGPADTAGAGGTTSQFQNPLGDGNLVLVWVFYQTDVPAVQISQISDGVNQYVLAAGPTASTVTPVFKQEIWYANNINPVPADAQGHVNISVSFQGGTPTEVQISAHEYTNNYKESDGPVADAPPAGTAGDRSDDAGNPQNLVVSGSVTTNGRLIFGTAWFRGSGAAGQNFRLKSAIKNNVVEDMDLMTPGLTAQAVFVNTSPTEGWTAQMITLK